MGKELIKKEIKRLTDLFWEKNGARNKLEFHLKEEFNELLKKDLDKINDEIEQIKKMSNALEKLL